MKKTVEELIAAVKELVGERNDDAVIALIEDISDSFVEPDTEDWKAKYYELDKVWRDKYIARFTEGRKPEEDPEDPNGEDDEADTSVSIEDLVI
ncbi:MAG TPA: hypothetical protein VIL29_04775 [Pseudothermotoga sp.]